MGSSIPIIGTSQFLRNIRTPGCPVTTCAHIATKQAVQKSCPTYLGVESGKLTHLKYQPPVPHNQLLLDTDLLRVFEIPFSSEMTIFTFSGSGLLDINSTNFFEKSPLLTAIFRDSKSELFIDKSPILFMPPNDLVISFFVATDVKLSINDSLLLNSLDSNELLVLSKKESTRLCCGNFLSQSFLQKVIQAKLGS